MKQPYPISPNFPPIFAKKVDSSKNQVSMISHIQNSQGIYPYLQNIIEKFESISKVKIETQAEDSDTNDMKNELFSILDSYSHEI